MTDGQKKELCEAFELFDSERTGFMDCHELKVAMRALGFQVKKRDVVALVEKVGRDDIGKVDQGDFLHIMRDKYAERDPDDEINKAFELFDDDGTGRISLRNLRRIARDLGEQLKDDELQAMIDEFDTDQDGEINKREFFEIMKQSEC